MYTCIYITLCRWKHVNECLLYEHGKPHRYEETPSSKSKEAKENRRYKQKHDVPPCVFTLCMTSSDKVVVPLFWFWRFSFVVFLPLQFVLQLSAANFSLTGEKKTTTTKTATKPVTRNTQTPHSPGVYVFFFLVDSARFLCTLENLSTV